MASQIISAAAGYAGRGGGYAVPQVDNGKADFDTKKRKVVWEVKDFKGGQQKYLEVSLSYSKDVLLDELQFKQVGPFTIEFDIPNHTASGVKVRKLDAKLVDRGGEERKEPQKWLRHKTVNGSYVSRV